MRRILSAILLLLTVQGYCFNTNNTIPAPIGFSTQTFCNAEALTLGDAAIFNTDDYTDIYWFATNDSSEFQLPLDTQVVGGNTYYVFQAINDDTAIGLAVSFELVNNIPAPEGELDPLFCETGDFTLNDIPVANNNGFFGIYWFSDQDQTTTLNPNTALVDGVTYYAFQGIGNCAAGIEITIHITELIPAPTGETEQIFCDNDVWCLLDIVISNTDDYNAIYWFDNQNQIGNPLLPHTLIEDGTTYYAFQGIGDCAVSLAVTTTIILVINVPGMDTDRYYCISDGATVGDFGVTDYWFLEPIDFDDPMPLPLDTILEDGLTYYGVMSLDQCATLIPITVHLIEDVPAPVGDEEQYFTEEITLADLAVFNTADYDTILWFDSDTQAGNQLDESTPVVHGETYYAFQDVGSCANDLAITTFVTLGLDDATASAFNIYPNPVKDKLKIEFVDLSTTKNIIISNIQGQIVKNINVQDRANYTINVSNYDNGIYFIKISSNNKTQIQKIIIK